MLRSDGRKLYIDNTSSYIEVLYSGGYYLHTNIGIVSSSFITSAAS